jgi:type IV fimbrial biogenesis protein FimT
MRQARLRATADRHRAGFTLVELMVTLAVAVVLITIAVPSFKHMMASSRLTTTANSLVGALNLARMEAIKRNDDTQFCGQSDNGGDTLGTACANAHAGAIVALTNGPAGASTQLHAAPVMPADSLHLKTVVPIKFSAQGLGHKIGAAGDLVNGTVAEICSTAIDSDNVRTISMTTGSIPRVEPSSTGDCP